MEISPLIPLYDVETLFKAYSTSLHPSVDAVTAAELPSEPLLAAVVRVLNQTNVLESQALAEKLGVSDRKLSGAVELLTGLPLRQFINEWRFMQSQQLLLNTELPYTQVATLCGYGNESTLIFNYEKRLKTTPHIFRTGYRISNPIYSINRHGYSNLLTGENRKAKNKVYSRT